MLSYCLPHQDSNPRSVSCQSRVYPLRYVVLKSVSKRFLFNLRKSYFWYEHKQIYIITNSEIMLHMMLHAYHKSFFNFRSFFTLSAIVCRLYLTEIFSLLLPYRSTSNFAFVNPTFFHVKIKSLCPFSGKNDLFAGIENITYVQVGKYLVRN